MKHTTMILIAFAIFAISSLVYADNVYQIGYQEGYKNGLHDKRTQVDFNYQNSYRVCECTSNHSYTDAQFREGYKDGYVEGYSEGVYVVRNYEAPVYRNYGNRVYTNYNSRVYSNSENRVYRSDGYVIAFKDDEFKGDLVQFQVGRYPDLDRMNWDDEIESIQIPSHVRVILFDDENFKGQSLILEGDLSNLDELNFKKRAESMIVEMRY